MVSVGVPSRHVLCTGFGLYGRMEYALRPVPDDSAGVGPKVNPVEPSLVTFTDSILWLPLATVPKASVEGVRLTYVPVPLKERVNEELLESPEKVVETVPLAGPDAVGVNTTLKRQDSFCISIVVLAIHLGDVIDRLY